MYIKIEGTSFEAVKDFSRKIFTNTELYFNYFKYLYAKYLYLIPVADFSDFIILMNLSFTLACGKRDI